MGWQLASLLQAVVKIKNIKWLAFDIYGTTRGDLGELFIKDNAGIVVFSNTNSLITSVEQVVQFEQGVFCLVRESDKVDSETETPETEAPEGMQLEKSISEIRTFDFSFFEIYSAEKNILNEIIETLPNPRGVSILSISRG